MLRFWLDKGVDGVRVDAIASLYEDYALRDEPLSGLTNDSVSTVWLDSRGNDCYILLLLRYFLQSSPFGLV